MKSVPNLISYLHDFSGIFSQFLAIFFELFSSGVIYLNSKFDWRVGPACQWQCRAAPSRDWLPRAALSGLARWSLNMLPAVPRPPPTPTASRRSPLTPPARTPRPSCRRPDNACPDHCDPKPPSPRPSPCRPDSLAACPWAAHALCNWAEREFDPVALKLIFLFFKYIQILVNLKICVGFFWKNYETNFVRKYLICTRL
jgi:hypothetical protein